MAVRTQFILTTGVSGSGKTYRRCAHYLVKEFLVNHTGVHISNFPIKLDALQDYCDRHNIKVVVADRVKLIEKSVLDSWIKGDSGPWDYFKDSDLSGVHFALDEAHNYCNKKSKPYIRELWSRWLGELRHMGMTAEFLTQNESNMANEVMNQCELRLEIINGENRIDPIMHIRMADWYELKAKFTGKYVAPSYELEYMQMKGRWKVQGEVKFFREAELFELYDSFSKPMAGGSSGKSELRHFERMSTFRFFCWFIGSNFAPFLRFGVMVSIFVWLLFFGGVKYTMKTIINSATKTLGNKGKVVEVQKKENEDEVDEKQENNEVIIDNKRRFIQGVKIKIITDEMCRFSDGTEFRVGDMYFDLRIVGFDSRRRRFMLEDGSYYNVQELLNY